MTAACFCSASEECTACSNARGALEDAYDAAACARAAWCAAQPRFRLFGDVATSAAARKAWRKTDTARALYAAHVRAQAALARAQRTRVGKCDVTAG